MRDVTCDSVIITRDLAVIRNHTDCKSQGHKAANATQRRSEELTFGVILVHRRMHTQPTR